MTVTSDSTLDPQTRLNITRWADEYITGVVGNHHGRSEDVVAIINDLKDLHDLHDQIDVIDACGEDRRELVRHPQRT